MNFILRISPLLFCCCLLFSPISAQQPASIHYTIDEGLPSNEVYDTYEDSLGYIWFATDHGISRFDGYSFRNYSTSDGLVHNTIFGFHEDCRGRLWMRTFNSSLCYLENDSLKPYAYNKQLQTFLGRDFIQRFAFDKAGNLWFVSIRKMLGLFKQDVHTGNIERIKLSSGFNAFIRELDSGEIIAGIDEDNGYQTKEQTNDSILYADHTWLFRMPESKTIDSRSLIRCQRKGKSAFVFTYDAQLAMIENGRISFRASFPQVVNECYVDNDKLWLCMNGFSQFNPATHEPTILKEFLGTSMLRDRMGNYWFTTIDNGVFLVRNMQLTALDRLRNQQFGELLCLNVYKNNLIALDNKGTVFRFGLSETGIDTLTSEIWPEKIPGANTFYGVSEKQRLFLQKNVYQINEQNLTWNSSRVVNGKMNVSGARGYAQTGDSLLIAGNNGWYISDMDGNFFYSSAKSGFTSFCTAIAVGPDHKIWIGTSDGFYVFSKNKTVPYEPTNPLFRQRVTDIEFGRNGEVFVSTRGGGLIIIDGNKQYNLRMKDGLSSDQCGNICVDDSVLWLCSNSGLNKISIHRNASELSFHIECINTQHGLPSMMVSDVVRAGNFLFLATGKGLAWFDVETLHFNLIPPPVYIRTFLTNNRETDTTANHLLWNDRNISIGFIALLFRSPGIVNYRYRLEGYETSWNYTTERMARYFNLPPGQYTFVVSAMNENGLWNDHPATMRFYIPAHFSETTWFRILIILLIISVAAGIVFYYLKQQRNRTQTILALAQAEQKALRAQMKPHFIFNSLNSIQNFIINHDDDSAHIYLTSFAQLMRRVLDHSRFSMITLQEELETMGIYLELEKLRFGETFRFAIDVQSDIQPATLLIPPLFIQPYIENAIWHGLQLQKNAPQLHIRFSIEKNKLICIIEDNGIGRKRSREMQHTQHHTSTGMKNVEERIALLNSTSREKISVEIVDLQDHEGNATGTRVVLHFPINRKEEN
jgi:ligand-binding sensor domain-containing protein